MIRTTLSALLFVSLIGCGASGAGSGAHTNAGDTSTDLQEGCPQGGHAPVEGSDGTYENCGVLFEGCCFTEASDACQAAGCEEQCEIMESYPGQLNRCEDAPLSCPAGGVAPEAGPDGVPENCAILFEGCCFADTSDACRAAGCGDECTYLQSYPGQLGRCE